MGQRRPPQIARTCRDHLRKPCRLERTERADCVGPHTFRGVVAARELLLGRVMRNAVLISFLLVAAAACKKPAPADETEPAAATAAPTATATATGTGDGAAKAKEIFANRCTPCHGPEGKGDGPASASLDPKPRNFHDKTWHGSIDDAYIEKIIKYGGAAVGKSPAMPGNPDLNDPVVVAELRAVVRSFNN